MVSEALGVCVRVCVDVGEFVGVPELEAVLEGEAPKVSEAVAVLVTEVVAVGVGVGGAQP